MTKPRYFTDTQLDELRQCLIAMGQQESSAFTVLDGYMHMRRALYAIEKVVDSMNRPRLGHCRSSLSLVVGRLDARQGLAQELQQ